MDYDLPDDLKRVLSKARALHKLVTEPMNLENNEIRPGEAVIAIGPVFCFNPVVCEFRGYVTGREGERYFQTPFRIILNKPSDPAQPKRSILVQTPENCRHYSGLMPTLADTIMAGINNAQEILARMRDYDVYADIIVREFGRVSKSVSRR